jgi:hypothetical protein
VGPWCTAVGHTWVRGTRFSDLQEELIDACGFVDRIGEETCDSVCVLGR